MDNDNPRPCPACGSDKAKHLGQKNAFRILSCRDCHTLFTDRLPTDSEAENYDDYYNVTNLSVPEFIRTRLKEILTKFEPYRKTNRLLDIGFGAGTLLEIGKEMGWDVYGLEVSRPAVEQAQDKGFNVVHNDLKNSGYDDDQFDVVTASEILEHLPDPEGDLREIARILRPGGLFWGTTPSADGISFKIMKTEWNMLAPPEHVQLYSSKGVRMLFAKAGFDQIKFMTHGVDPYEILRHYRKGSDRNVEHSRMNSAYELNENLTRDPFRKAVKSAINGSLNLLGIGDSLKIFATTPNR